ncbi:LuxR C-terminal-related transcriptional regulator [Streptomyces sp. NPDC101234]|uniref:helix-turn-helix transcriptional regulator n=1 Tax=Streptomyces sp. NPDC101234 TaxID=3366138 RepID=UPI00381673B3
MTYTPHIEHGIEDLCDAGTKLYEHALRQGRLSAEDVAEAPCLVDLGLLHPALDDVDRLEPVAPDIALNRLLRGSRARVAEEWRLEERLVELLGPLTNIQGIPGTTTDSPALRLLSGTRRINQALDEAMTEARLEVLCVQPHAGLVGERGEAALPAAHERDQTFLDRGGRFRTLYQHTLRHLPNVYTYAEDLKGDSEARGLDEVPDRLVVIDQTVAFVPANADGTLALEVRHPALVKYLTTTFERLWRLATPMFPKTEQRPTVNGITPRQQAIAALLVEGHTDAVIADRLGMNVRTARVHIAKLAATLGSESRAQLGYLIAQSGALAQLAPGKEAPADAHGT